MNKIFIISSLICFIPLIGCGPSENEQLKQAAERCANQLRSSYSWTHPETMRIESFKKVDNELRVIVMAQNGFGNFIPSSKTCILTKDNAFDLVATLEFIEKDPESIMGRGFQALENLEKMLKK